MKSSLGGGEYAFREVLSRAALLRESCAPFVDLLPGMVGLEDCERLPTDLKTKRTVTTWLDALLEINKF